MSRQQDDIKSDPLLIRLHRVHPLGQEKTSSLYDEQECHQFEYEKVIESAFTKNPYYFLTHSLIHVPCELMGSSIPKIFSQDSELVEMDKYFILEEPQYINAYHRKYLAGYDFTKLVIPKIEKTGFDLEFLPKSNYGQYNFTIPRIIGKKHILDTFSKIIVSTHQINANNTIEDMFLQKFIHSSRTLLMGVFDGHGGNLCAKFCKDYFTQLFYKRLDFTLDAKFHDYCSKFLIDSVQIKTHIRYIISFLGALRELEALWIKQVEIHNELSKMGSCACICAIHNNFIMVANLGDSLAFTITQNKVTKKHKIAQLNMLHCTTYTQTHQKLRKKLSLDKIPIHPSIADIKNLYTSIGKTVQVTEILRLLSQIKFSDQFKLYHLQLFPEIKEEDLSYQQLMQILALQLELPFDKLVKLPARVNGSLMLTQTIGDYYLKNKNESYLFMEPSVCYNELETSEFSTVALVIVSDGVTNYLDMNEIADIVLDTSFNYNQLHDEKQFQTIQQILNKNIAQRINYQVLEKASSQIGITIEQMLMHENKRSLYDDMTTQVILFNQDF